MKKKVYRERYIIPVQDSVYSKEELIKEVSKETLKKVSKTTRKKSDK